MAASKGSHVRKQIMDEKPLLDVFWLISESDAAKRISGVENLIKILRAKQSNINNKKKVKCSEEVTYSVERVIQGLASCRLGVRQGYSSALTHILKEFECVSLDAVLKIITSKLEMKGDKQDIREAAIGQVFAYTCIVRSGVLHKNVDVSHVTTVTKALQGLSKHRQYLPEICTQSIADIVSAVDEKFFVDNLLPILRTEMETGFSKTSPEQFQLLLTCHRCFPAVIDRKFLKQFWKTSDLFNSNNFQDLKIIVAASSKGQPTLHPVCVEILKGVVPKPDSVKVFWQHIVTDFLLKTTAERKHMAFRLTGAALDVVDCKSIGYILNSSIIIMYMKALADREHPLALTATQLTDQIIDIVSRCDDESTKPYTIITTLLSKPGSVNFDLITKTKTISNLMSCMKVSGLHNLTQWLKELFINIGSTQESFVKSSKAMSVRKSIASYMTHMVRSQLGDCKLWNDILQFFTVHGCFTHTKQNDKFGVAPSPVVDPTTQQCVRLFLTAVLNKLSSLPPENYKTISTKVQRIHGLGPSGDFWVHDCVQLCELLRTDTEHFQPCVEFSDELNDVWSKMWNSVEILRKKRKKMSEICESTGLELLFLNIAVQVFIEPKQAMELLKEVDHCQSKLFEDKKNKQKRKTPDREPDWVDVLLDILVNFLSKTSNTMRSVVETVFTMIAPHVTESSVTTLVDVLLSTTSDQLKSANQSDSEDDDVIDDEDAEDQSESEADEEEISEDDVESLNESESGEEDTPIDEDFRNNIRTALGETAAKEEESESDVSDSEMFKIDAALAQAFKLRTGKQTTRNKIKIQKETRQQLAHFKLRVLDLVDLYIRLQPENILILSLVVPLLKVIRTSVNSKDMVVVADKAGTIFKNKLCHIRKYCHNIDSHIDNIHDILKELMALASKASSLQEATLISNGCLFLIRVLRGNHSETPESALGFGCLKVKIIRKSYLDLLIEFMTKRNCNLHVCLFTLLIDRVPELGWCLAIHLSRFTVEAIQPYRQIQACKMLTQLLSRKSTETCLKESELKKFIISMSDTSLQVLNSLLENDPKWKPQFYLEMLTVISKFITFVKKIDKQSYCGDFTNIAEVIENVLKSNIVAKSNAMRTSCNVIMKLLQINVKKQHKKRKKTPSTCEDVQLSSSDPTPEVNGNDTEIQNIKKIKLHIEENDIRKSVKKSKKGKKK